MGGDEFCVLIEPGADDPEQLVRSAAAALSETGDGFTIGCSYGSILLPDEAADPAEALRIADQRMYAQKHAGPHVGRPPEQGRAAARADRAQPRPRRPPRRASPSSPSAPRAGSGCPPRRSSGSATPASCTTPARSRSPTAILSKPGPLTEDEWAFVRRHPLIGERIVRSAPSLSRVAELVRSTHERFDGAGYPDRLQADAIPLGSRIVAVCDAFDAMTSERPYAAAAHRRRRRSTSCAAAPARSSTRRSSRRSAPWSPSARSAAAA